MQELAYQGRECMLFGRCSKVTLFMVRHVAASCPDASGVGSCERKM